MNSARKGNAKENRTAALLDEQGWTVASRRHLAGPGDLLAVRAGEMPRLIEVKATRSAYEHFRQADRDEMREFAAERGLRAELAWWRPRSREPRIIGVDEWPP